MYPQVDKKPRTEQELPDQGHCSKNSTINNNNNNNPLIQCAELILPWLTPQELSNISRTCKTLSGFSQSITLQRTLDASRSLETHSIPFHINPTNINKHNRNHYDPYAYFLYTPSQILPSQSPSRQPWGCPRFFSSKVGRLSVGTRSCIGCDLASFPTESGEIGSESQRVDDDDSVSQFRDDLMCGCGCGCEGCGGGGDACEFLGLEEGEEEVGIRMECGPRCPCGLECGNRLTQRGILVKLKIVRDERKGWGLFADQLIRKGQFVCEYAGELLTTKEARRRQQIYDDLASGGHFSSSLLVVREHLPSGKACLRINIDATRIGNVARFINHSCDGGNLSTVIVRSLGVLLPHLCFFASKDIKEGEELTFSYGEIRVRSKGLQCFCGSSCCFGALPSEHT